MRSLAVSQGTHLNSLLPNSRGHGKLTYLQISRQINTSRISCFSLDVLLGIMLSAAPWQIPHLCLSSSCKFQVGADDVPLPALHSKSQHSREILKVFLILQCSAPHPFLCCVCCLGATFIFPAALACQGGALGELGALLASRDPEEPSLEMSSHLGHGSWSLSNSASAFENRKYSMICSSAGACKTSECYPK